MSRRGRPLAETVADYLALLQRDPAAPNRVLAQRMGMTHDALVQALYRARKVGLLTVYRYAPCAGCAALAPPGVTVGYLPGAHPRQTELRRLKRRANRAARLTSNRTC